MITLEEKKTNNNATIKTRVGGTGICGLLTVAFIVLKLVGIINWSWFWVLAPIWIEIAIVLILLIIIGICCYISKVKR